MVGSRAVALARAYCCREHRIFAHDRCYSTNDRMSTEAPVGIVIHGVGDRLPIDPPALLIQGLRTRNVVTRYILGFEAIRTGPTSGAWSFITSNRCGST